MTAGKITRVILFPRFSSLAGPNSYATEPLAVRDFYATTICCWRNVGINDPELDLVFEGSCDLRYWTELASPFEVSTGDPQLTNFVMQTDWFRVTAVVAGAGASVNLWAYADLIQRSGC